MINHRRFHYSYIVVDADKKNKDKVTTETEEPHTAPRSTYALGKVKLKCLKT